MSNCAHNISLVNTKYFFQYKYHFEMNIYIFKYIKEIQKWDRDAVCQ